MSDHSTSSKKKKTAGPLGDLTDATTTKGVPLWRGTEWIRSGFRSECIRRTDAQCTPAWQAHATIPANSMMPSATSSRSTSRVERRPPWPQVDCR